MGIVYNTPVPCTTDLKLNFEQAQEATRESVRRAALKIPGQRPTLLLLDLPTGAGKTYSALLMKLLAASGGTTEALLQPRHSLMKESAKTCSKMAAELGIAGEAQVLGLMGKGKLCLRPERLREAQACGNTSLAGVCDECGDRFDCPYQLQFDKADRPNTLILAPHGMALSLSRRGLIGEKIWYDEVPQLWEEIELSFEEIRAYLGDFDVSQYPEEIRGEVAQYFEVRREAAACYVKLISEVSKKAKRKYYRKVYYGPYLKKCMGSNPVAEALGYSPAEGSFPIIHTSIKGPWPRRDFDLFRVPLLSLLEGTCSVRDGAVGVYVDPDGGSGLVLLKRKLLAPVGHSCVVMAAGVSHLQPLLKVLYPEWDIVAERVEAALPSHTQVLSYRYSRFLSEYLILEVNREDSLRNTLLGVLPRILASGAQKGNGNIVAALVCPKRIADDVRKGLHEKLLNIYLTCGVELLVESIEHYGNLDGSNRFSTVDVWIMLGAQMPNLSILDMMFHSLQNSGEELAAPKEVFGAYHYEQNFGRPRPFSRTVQDPLLIIEVRWGNKKWREKALSCEGRPKLKTVLYETLAEFLLVIERKRSAPMMRQLYEAFTGPESGIGPYWGNKVTVQGRVGLTGLLSLVNREGRSQKFDDRFARKVLARLKKGEKMMRKRRETNRSRTGASTMYRYDDPLEGTCDGAGGPIMLGGCKVFDTFEQFLAYGHRKITDFEDYRTIRILELEEAVLNLTTKNISQSEDFPWGDRYGEAYARDQSIRCRAKWNQKLLRHHHLETLYRHTELPFAMLLLKMNQHGLPISAEALESYVGSGRQWVEQVLKEVRANSGRVRSVHTWSPFGGVYATAPVSPFLEKKLRHVVRVAEGKVLIEADYRAHQPSVLGYISGDQLLIDYAESETDVYALLAEFLLPGKKLTRETVKRFVLPLVNGCTVQTLAKELDLETNDIEAMERNFWVTLFPRATEYLERVRLRADEYPHVVRTPYLCRFGWFPGIPLDKSELQWERWRASSFVLMGTCADILKTMSVMLYKKLPPGARIILTVHDSILIEAPLDLAQEVCNVCHRVLPHPPGFQGVLKIRTRVGPSWGELKEVKPRFSLASSRSSEM